MFIDFRWIFILHWDVQIQLEMVSFQGSIFLLSLFCNFCQMVSFCVHILSPNGFFFFETTTTTTLFIYSVLGLFFLFSLLSLHTAFCFNEFFKSKRKFLKCTQMYASLIHIAMLTNLITFRD